MDSIIFPDPRMKNHYLSRYYYPCIGKTESTFDGSSLSIVDGQQRLTTLILLCCVLIEELFLRQDEAHNFQEPTKSWIKREIDFISERLFDCV